MSGLASVLNDSIGAGWIGNFLTEALILTGGAALGYAGTLWRRAVRMRTLRRAFGRNVTSPDKFFISVPLWSCKPGDRAVPRFARRSPAGERQELYGPDNTFAMEDILGGMLISDLLARYFKKPLKVLPDDQKLNWDGRTGILIGAQTANFHVASVVKVFGSTYPDDLLIDIEVHEENEDTKGKITFVDKTDGTVFRSDYQCEYALIQRLSNRFSEDHTGYIFILAGVHASGTYAACQYLRNRWKRFARRPGPAAVLLKMEYGHPETALAVREYWPQGQKA
ncbi:hypothetical protein E5163_09175 [Marinicauda algicola]|uniref:Uncharacterized protein n=1 Tax=Marinicauda algicola TaxID=2029849 RepID=A0A4V3RY71_9PROT|nr:hypothetical protein [Marinicauda algicola]TGY89279.1 hypothetical protein E5163_09175 [Marinicauda algicola]